MRTMATEFILAVDVGAGSLRAGLVRADGRVSAAAAIPLVTREPRRGWAEFDPELWWHALLAASTRVLRALPKSGRVAGVCVCGLTRTQVLLDRRGRALGPAILFRDRRAAQFAGVGLTAFDAPARLAWIEHHQPARFARIDRVVEPKDFLNLRLTGVIAGDTVTHSRQPSAATALAQCDLVAPWQAIGEVAPAAPALARIAGAPVFAGSMDTWASAVGSGAVNPGQAYDVAGTSEAVGLVTAAKCTVAGLMSLAWTERTYQVGGPTQAGADCARWCHESFRVRGGLASAIERAGRLPRRVDRPSFLPYLSGERAPVWNSQVRGAFHGVDRASVPDDFLWAVLEGVAMAVRDIVAHAAAGTGTHPDELRVCGGGARSNAWCQLKADVLAVPVVRSSQVETGVIGAAMAAAVGLGLYDSVRAAAKMAGAGRTFAPHRDAASFYDRRASGYRLIKEAALALAAQEND